jgi:hypothetical protein
MRICSVPEAEWLTNELRYRDGSQPQADLGEGRIQFLVTSLTASSSPVQIGKAHFLAVIAGTPFRIKLRIPM